MLCLAGVHANTAGWPVGDEGVRVEFGWPLFNSDDCRGRVTGKFLQVEAVCVRTPICMLLPSEVKALKTCRAGAPPND